MKIGFAITAYDKFEEAKILFEIIREEFQENHEISFCSNHEKGKDFAKKEGIKYYAQGRNIPYYGGDIHRPDTLKNRVSIVLRSTDTVRQSCQNALNMDVDYIIHMHSDAWVLNEKKLIDLISELNLNKKKFALRGAGLEELYQDAPLGHMDDHFFIFDRKYCLDNKVFEFKPEHFFPHIFTVHGILFINILTKIGLDKIWYYQNTKNLLNYDNKVLGMRTVKPVSYDPIHEFFHLHRGSFPDNYGKKIQAVYLKEAGFNKSEYINKFINENYENRSKLIIELNSIEFKIDKKLKRYFYPQKVIQNREINYKEKLLQHSNFKKFIYNLSYRFGKAIYLKVKNKNKIDDIADFYKNIVKISDFVEDDWTSSLYKISEKAKKYYEY